MNKLGTALAIIGLGGIVASAVTAAEDVLAGKIAKKMLFSHKGSEFVIQPQDFMTDTDVSVLKLMADMREFKAVLYYGAIAASPKDGLTHKATVATSNHHSIAAAEAAATAECDELRSEGADCVVVANILPKKYTEQPFHLSASATTAFKKTYLRGGGAKALAISPNVGSYAISKGDAAAAAALSACGADGATDCVLVVQD